MLTRLASARRAAPITSLPLLMFGGGELSELEKATIMGRVTQRRATIPEASRYSKVYARSGACALMSASNETIALSIFHDMPAPNRQILLVDNPITPDDARRFFFG